MAHFILYMKIELLGRFYSPPKIHTFEEQEMEVVRATSPK